MRTGALLLLLSSLAIAGCDRPTVTIGSEKPPQSSPANSAAGAPPSLAPMLARVSPAVVNVSVEGTVEQEVNPAFKDPLLRRFFNLPDTPKKEKEDFSAVGSGVIFDQKNGYILTNAHVTENANRVLVTLKDGRQLDAKVVGADSQTDIAVLKIDPANLTSLPLGDSKQVQVGDYVVAIGNPFGLGQTATFGIVSAIGRSGLGIEGYEDFIQTDASINPGNSGGALVNLRGELIGINAAIISRSGGNVGVGFAVPMNMAKAIAQQLIESGKVSRGSLGVMVQDLTPSLAQAMDLDRTGGAVVAQVSPRSPAAKAGIQVGDVITSLDGDKVDTSAQLRNAIGGKMPGTDVHVTLLRDGKEQTITASLDPLVEKQKQAALDPQAAHEKDTAPLFGITPGLAPGRGIRSDAGGVYVTKVDVGSAAAHAGLEEGDVIVSANRVPLNSPSDLARALSGRQNGKPTLLQVRRKDSLLFMAVG